MTAPGKEPWEVYTVTADARPDLEGETSRDLVNLSEGAGCSCN